MIGLLGHQEGFVAATYLAQQVPQLQTPPFSPLPSTLPSPLPSPLPSHVHTPAPGLQWPGHSDSNPFQATLESLANHGHFGMHGSVATGSPHADKEARAQTRTDGRKKSTPKTQRNLPS